MQVARRVRREAGQQHRPVVRLAAERRDREAVSRGDFAIHLTLPSSEHLQRWASSLGALVCGRTLFEVAEGWQGRHTLSVPVVVVTHRVPTEWVEAHPRAPFTFVTDGVAAAVAHAQTLAGDRLAAEDVLLGNPSVCVQGDRVTHLVYPVVR